MVENTKEMDQVFGSRPTWDEYFMAMAELASTRSTCRRQVGAVITKNNEIVSIGYNGAPKGLAHCSQLGGCLRMKNNIPSGTRQEFCRAVHAEQNAIVQAAKQGVSILGGTLYVTTYPCSICARMIINSELKRIVYAGDYMDDNSKAMLNESGIAIEQFRPEKRLIMIMKN